jgi:hypothetical protein
MQWLNTSTKWLAAAASQSSSRQSTCILKARITGAAYHGSRPLLESQW